MSRSRISLRRDLSEQGLSIGAFHPLERTTVWLSGVDIDSVVDYLVDDFGNVVILTTDGEFLMVESIDLEFS